MKSINSIRVRNLRSFGKTSKYIPIKKINVLVGRNSCGKSTLLRTFPLIRQSIEAKT
ncbi:AAA family ATPase [Pseudomonas canadensis]|uniref:AAA family ATPase n=1 Tax=Pseudomonas canadensis TaxID=915099 RepID=UPI003BA121A2